MTRDDAVGANEAAGASEAARASKTAGSHHTAIAHEATRSRKGETILISTPQFPYPPHQGTTLRNYNLIKGLAQRHRVHLHSFGDPETSRGTP